MGKNSRLSQSIIGYILIFIVVIAALLGMSKYMRNAMSGKLRQAGDSFGGGAQYDPGTGYGAFSTGGTTTGADD